MCFSSVFQLIERQKKKLEKTKKLPLLASMCVGRVNMHVFALLCDEAMKQWWHSSSFCLNIRVDDTHMNEFNGKGRY